MYQLTLLPAVYEFSCFTTTLLAFQIGLILNLMMYWILDGGFYYLIYISLSTPMLCSELVTFLPSPHANEKIGVCPPPDTKP